MLGREFAETEVGADFRVRRVGFRPLQVGRVLHGLEGGIQALRAGVAHAGGADAGALGVFQQGLVALDAGDGGVQRDGFVRRPALAGDGVGIGRQLDGGDDGASARELRLEVVGLVDAHLELFRQFHGLALEGQLGGFLGHVNQMLEVVDLVQLRLREDADIAAFLFLAGDLQLDGGQQGDGSGEKARLEAGREFGMGGGRIEDEFALAHENGQREVEVCFLCAHGFCICSVFVLYVDVLTGCERVKMPKLLETSRFGGVRRVQKAGGTAKNPGGNGQMPGGKRTVAREPGNCAEERLRPPGERDNCPGENAKCAGEPDNCAGEMARCPGEQAGISGDAARWRRETSRRTREPTPSSRRNELP